jgi:DNA-binding NtrC family response regulator
VDLAAIPPTLVAAELFGTARGAFSGAADRAGRFERANGGTLLLDEIGNLPQDAQRLLLLVIEAGRVTRQGESQPRPVDVRLIAATNADLSAAVRAGTFRADLYARLNPAVRLVLPPLRERQEDLPELMAAFLARTFTRPSNASMLSEFLAAAGLAGPPLVELALGKTPASSKGATFAFAPAGLRALRAHTWPGNLRELEHLVAATALFSLADALQASEAGRASGPGMRTIPIPLKLIHELLQSPDGGSAPAPGQLMVDVSPAPSLHQLTRTIESQLLSRLFDETDGDFERMAASLLQGHAPGNARRVRLRFNQLGLRARRRRPK